MPALPHLPTESQPHVERRALLKAAAWSAPVIAVAIATPLAAASETALVCDPAANGSPLTVSHGTWATTSGTLKTDENETGWYGTNGFRTWDNNASDSEDAVVTATFTFQALKGATYDIGATVEVGPGGGQGGISKQNVWIDIVSSAGEQKLTAVHTSNGVPYPDDIPGYTTQYTWSAAPVPYSTTFVAATTETVTLRYRFTLLPTTRVNDDIWVNNLTVSQIACSV